MLKTASIPPYGSSSSAAICSHSRAAGRPGQQRPDLVSCGRVVKKDKQPALGDQGSVQGRAFFQSGRLIGWLDFQRGLAAAGDGRDRDDARGRVVRDQVIELPQFGEPAGEMLVGGRKLMQAGGRPRSRGRTRAGVGDQCEQLSGLFGGQVERARDQPDRFRPWFPDASRAVPVRPDVQGRCLTRTTGRHIHGLAGLHLGDRVAAVRRFDPPGLAVGAIHGDRRDLASVVVRATFAGRFQTAVRPNPWSSTLLTSAPSLLMSPRAGFGRGASR